MNSSHVLRIGTIEGLPFCSRGIFHWYTQGAPCSCARSTHWQLIVLYTWTRNLYLRSKRSLGEEARRDSFSLGLEIWSLFLVDATAFSRLPCCAGHHRPERPLRTSLTRGLPFLALLSSPDDYTRLLGGSGRFGYQTLAYPGDCFVVGVIELEYLFCCRRWNGMKVDGVCDFGRVLWVR